MVIILRNYVSPLLKGFVRPAAWTALGSAVLCWCVLCVWGGLVTALPDHHDGTVRFLCVGGIDLKKNFPIHEPDRQFLTSEYAEAANFLNRNLGKNETFYTLTSEAAFYYLVERPCPTRFLLLFYAAPVPNQEELLRDLDSHRVKYLILDSPCVMNRLDGFTTPIRTPLVAAYAVKKYHPCVSFGQIRIWERNQPADR